MVLLDFLLLLEMNKRMKRLYFSERFMTEECCKYKKYQLKGSNKNNNLLSIIYHCVIIDNYKLLYLISK